MLKEHKMKTNQTYMEISMSTGIGMSLIVQIISGKYQCDLSLNYASTLAEWMDDNICNYFK